MKKTMLAAMCLTALAASAIPAKKGVVCTVDQPDGTSLRLTLHGDEHSHYYLTEDGKAVIGTDQGYFYAVLDSDGNLERSLTLAHQPEERLPEEVNLLASIDGDAVRKAFSPYSSAMKRATHNGIGTSSPGYPTLGQRKGLCFLVEYADVPFTIDNPYEYFYNMLNQEGFSELNGTGSCRDYYIANSNGLYQPDFDVYGPVTLPNNRSYYGGNDSWGNDKNPQYMMLHAAQALNDEVDFSQYDLDDDGFVDNVFIFYAGEGEAGGGGANTVWPHSWEYAFSNRFDGVRFSRYACGPEMTSHDLADGVGTFCHEFAHVLGLPDLYNTEDPSKNYTPLNWSLMDQGCYNNDSRTPAGLSAFERNALGWMGDLLTEPVMAGEYALESLAGGNGALLLPTSKTNEFFILENRQQEGWDQYLPYHGMLVWHIDYQASAWRNNNPNNNESHQRVDIVEACNRTYSTAAGLRRYPFPGSNKVTSLGFNTEPALKSWAGTDLGFELTNIKETNRVVTFNLDGASGIGDIQLETAQTLVTGRRVCAKGSNVVITDISGRTVATGSDIDTTLPSAGIYLIHADGKTSKIAVR